MARRRRGRQIWTVTKTTGENANANETSPANRDFAGPSKNRPISGAIKAEFRQAAKTATRDDDEIEPTEKNRKGETEGEFQRFARVFVRRVDMRAAFRGRTVIARRAP